MTARIALILLLALAWALPADAQLGGPVIAARTGRIPPVIDAEDLLSDPQGVTAAWCEAVGIAFMADALEWDTSEGEAHSWWESGSWHGNLERSKGFARQPRDYVSVDHNDHLRTTYALCRPHYDALRVHRLTP